MPTLQTLEEVSYNAWPTIHNIFYDGWILRIANGFTKRANSINPLYSTSIDLDKKISFCNKLYRNHGIKPTYKITHVSFPNHIDDRLAELGFQKIDETSVQWLDLSTFQKSPLHADFTLLIEDHYENGWMEKLAEFNNISDEDQQHLGKILDLIQFDHWYYILKQQEEIVACASGVIQEEYFGLYDIVVSPKHRQKGVGTFLINAMLTYALHSGAEIAYLQVVTGNDPAVQLYRKFGFEELYRYWYRIPSV